MPLPPLEIRIQILSFQTLSKGCPWNYHSIGNMGLLPHPFPSAQPKSCSLRGQFSHRSPLEMHSLWLAPLPGLPALFIFKDSHIFCSPDSLGGCCVKTDCAVAENWGNNTQFFATNSVIMPYRGSGMEEHVSLGLLNLDRIFGRPYFSLHQSLAPSVQKMLNTEPQRFLEGKNLTPCFLSPGSVTSALADLWPHVVLSSLALALRSCFLCLNPLWTTDGIGTCWNSSYITLLSLGFFMTWCFSSCFHAHGHFAAAIKVHGVVLSGWKIQLSRTSPVIYSISICLWEIKPTSDHEERIPKRTTLSIFHSQWTSFAEQIPVSSAL